MLLDLSPVTFVSSSVYGRRLSICPSFNPVQIQGTLKSCDGIFQHCAVISILLGKGGEVGMLQQTRDIFIRKNILRLKTSFFHKK